MNNEVKDNHSKQAEQTNETTSFDCIEECIQKSSV